MSKHSSCCIIYMPTLSKLTKEMVLTSIRKELHTKVSEEYYISTSFSTTVLLYAFRNICNRRQETQELTKGKQCITKVYKLLEHNTPNEFL